VLQVKVVRFPEGKDDDVGRCHATAARSEDVYARSDRGDVRDLRNCTPLDYWCYDAPERAFLFGRRTSEVYGYHATDRDHCAYAYCGIPRWVACAILCAFSVAWLLALIRTRSRIRRTRQMRPQNSQGVLISKGSGVNDGKRCCWRGCSAKVRTASGNCCFLGLCNAPRSAEGVFGHYVHVIPAILHGYNGLATSPYAFATNISSLSLPLFGSSQSRRASAVSSRFVSSASFRSGIGIASN